MLRSYLQPHCDKMINSTRLLRRLGPSDQYNVVVHDLCGDSAAFDMMVIPFLNHQLTDYCSIGMQMIQRPVYRLCHVRI